MYKLKQYNRIRSLVRLSVFIVVFCISFASAEQVKEKFPPLEWDQYIVNEIAKIAREQKLPKAELSDGSVVGIETAEEKARPLLSEKTVKAVVDNAVFWNTVHWCGFSLKKYSFPEAEDKSKWTEKQYAYIAVLHGTATGLVMKQLAALGTCSDGFKSFLRKNYPKQVD